MLKKYINLLKEKFSIQWIVYFFLAIVAFNFLDSFNFLIFSSVIVAVILAIFYRKKIDTNDLISLLLFIIPLISFGILAGTSKYNLDPAAPSETENYVFLVLAFIALPFIGFLGRSNKQFNIKTALKVIYIVLGAWMLINFLITVVQYGPFYTFIYKDRYLFEYGHLARLSVDRTSFMLLGFSVEMVSSEYFVLFASILSSAILGVFFVSFKEDKRSFLEYLICGSIGLLCLILTINKTFYLSYFALLVIFIFVVLFGKKILKWNKVTKIVLFSFMGFVVFLVLIFVLNALDVKFISDIVKENAFLTRFFVKNREVYRYYNIIHAFAESKCKHGFTPYLIGQDDITFSGSWLFDMIAITQLTGWAVFMIFIVLIFVRYVKYAKTSKDDISIKVLIIGFILGLLVISLFRYDSMPYFDSTNFLPLYFTVPFVLLLVIYGYIGESKEAIE